MTQNSFMCELTGSVGSACAVLTSFLVLLAALERYRLLVIGKKLSKKSIKKFLLLTVPPIVLVFFLASDTNKPTGPICSPGLTWVAPTPKEIVIVVAMNVNLLAILPQTHGQPLLRHRCHWACPAASWSQGRS